MLVNLPWHHHHQHYYHYHYHHRHFHHHYHHRCRLTIIILKLDIFRCLYFKQIVSFCMNYVYTYKWYVYGSLKINLVCHYGCQMMSPQYLVEKQTQELYGSYNRTQWANGVELWYFLWCLPEQAVEQTVESCDVAVNAIETCPAYFVLISASPILWNPFQF